MSVVKKFIPSYKNQNQKTKAVSYLLFVLLFLIFYFPAITGMAADSVPLKEITVVSDDNYPPFIFRDEKDNLQGILVDEWRLWEEKTGIKVDLRGMDWDKAKKTMAEGNAQVIDTIFFTEERAKTLAFSAPYASLDVPIFFHRDISGIKDVKSLHGFTIGVKAGDACVNFLKRNGIHTLREYPSYESIVRDATEQKIKVFCIDSPPAHYYLYKMNLEQQYRHTAPLYTGQFHRAVQRERKDLLTAVEEGFAKISPKEHEEIEKRWRGSPIARPYLTYLLYLMGGVAILGAILMLWNDTLRRKVAQQTVQLREAIDALKKSEDKYRLVVENAEEAILIAQDGLLKYVNPITITMLGYSEEVLTSIPFVDLIHPEDRERLFEAHIRIMKGEESQPVYQFRVLTADGTVRWADSRAVTISWEGKPATLNFITDVTERKRAEEALRKSEERYRMILENIEDGYFEVDIAGNFTFFNDSVCRMAGYPRAELMGMNNRQYTDKENRQISYQAFNKVFRTGEPSRGIDYEIIGKDGIKLNIESSVSLIRNTSGQPIGFRGIMRNITERKQAEEACRNAEERYRTLFEQSPNGILLIDPETGKTIESNETAHKQLGYTREEFAALRISDYEALEKPEETAKHIQKVIHVGIDDFETLHRTKSGEIRNVHVWAKKVQLSDRSIFYALFQDITEHRRAEKQLQDTLESLRKAVSTTIQVMVSTVEARDPYTAGHQIRSSDLARAIATEMGLPQEKIDAIRMAGSIHDIGKISIPAEILSKPTKLSEIEFSLIKEHAQRGFEMLKDVESPWPLAEIVRQHHERMDGSGYPRKMKGEEILIEARILSVADVVEAMASHRPYRPGLGIDAALNEIEKNRGIFYDNAVADACLRLFREKDFKLEGA